MSKSKKQKISSDYQLKFIKESNYKHENFARLYRSVAENERFLSVSNTAKIIYLLMILECNGNSRTTCKYPHSRYIRICTKQTFIKAKRELIENGFIEEIHFPKRASIYKLCDDWKLDVIPDKEPTAYDVSKYKYYLNG